MSAGADGSEQMFENRRPALPGDDGYAYAAGLDRRNGSARRSANGVKFMRYLLLAVGVLCFATVVAPEKFSAANADSYYSQRNQQNRDYARQSDAARRAYRR